MRLGRGVSFPVVRLGTAAVLSLFLAAPIGVAAAKPKPSGGGAGTKPGSGSKPGSKTKGSKPGSKTKASGAKPSPAVTMGTWTTERALSEPVARDLFPPTVAITSTGSVLIGYGVTNEDDEGQAHGEVLASTGTVRTVTPHKRGVKRTQDIGTLGTTFAPVAPVPDEQRVLAVGALGNQPVLISGTSLPATAPATSAATTSQVAVPVEPCCSEADAAGIAPEGFFTSGQTLATTLGGPATASLIEEKRGAVAVIASSNGIWASLGANKTGAFGKAHELTPISSNPPAFASGPLFGGRSLVVWTTPRRTLQIPTEGQTVYYAVGPAGAVPEGPPRVAFHVRAGKTVSQVAVANRGSVGTLAWLETWFDSKGVYHSQVFASDLNHGRFKFRPISPRDVIATQPAFAGGGGAREVLTWQACAPGALTCTAQAALRSGSGQWGHARTLGKIDTGDAPSAAVTTRGAALVGWVHDGRPTIAEAGYSRWKFTAAHALQRTGLAAGLTLATGPLGFAAAVWIDGTARQSVHASFYKP